MFQRYRFLLVGFMCIVLLLLPTAKASAADKNLFMNQNTVISAGQSVENVVVVGGDATVSGIVRDAVILLNGNLTVKKTAHINGLVLVIGGTIQQEPGATLMDNVLNINFNTATKNNAVVAGAVLLGYWIWRVVFSFMILVIPIATVFVMKGRMEPFRESVRYSLRQLLLIGFLTSLLLGAISVLLSFTIIGIPIVMIVFFVVLLFFFLGLSSTSLLIGEWVPGTRNHALLKTLGGAVVLTAAVNLPLLGALTILFLVWLSLGLLVTWILDRKRRKRIGG